MGIDHDAVWWLWSLPLQTRVVGNPLVGRRDELWSFSLNKTGFWSQIKGTNDYLLDNFFVSSGVYVITEYIFKWSSYVDDDLKFCFSFCNFSALCSSWMILKMFYKFKNFIFNIVIMSFKNTLLRNNWHNIYILRMFSLIILMHVYTSETITTIKIKNIFITPPNFFV